VRELTLENARWFQGAWAGPHPTSVYVRSVWLEKYRRPDEKYLRRPVIALSSIADAFLVRRSGWDPAGLQAFLAETVLESFERTLQFKLRSLPLAELHLPDLPEGQRDTMVTPGLFPSFKQLNSPLHNFPNLGEAKDRIALLSSYQSTLEMLLNGALHGEPRETVTGLALLDHWMNAMSEGLQEYKLPEVKLREEIYRIRTVQQIQKTASRLSTAQNQALNDLLDITLEQHITKLDFYKALRLGDL